MESAYQYENKLMKEAFTELRLHSSLSARLNEKLLKIFGDRFTNALDLVESHKVRQYEFKPSRRTVWVVQGRKSRYQVIPDLPFCYCDDYYFRVMDRKRGLCYHIIAQRIAEATNRFQKMVKNDAQYSTITNPWRAKEPTRD